MWVSLIMRRQTTSRWISSPLERLVACDGCCRVW